MSKKRRSTRRDFLRGASAVDALADLTHGIDADTVPFTASPTSRPPAKTGYLSYATRPAMACEFTIFQNADQYRNGHDAAMEALDVVEQLEDQMTVYRGHSEISQINRKAFEQDVKVEHRLFGLLLRCEALFHATDGAFDITAGPLSKVWGFVRREGRIPSDEELAAARAISGGDLMVLNEEQRSIRFRKDGVNINLGGIGKGFALDNAVAQMVVAGVSDFLMHGGHSSVIARGNRLTTDGKTGWTVGVVHPLRPKQRLAEVTLRDKAIGTSGAGSQHFYHQGKKYGHILDPRTGQPAEGVLSASVICQSAADADALATAMYVLGVDRCGEFCEQHPETGAVIVTRGRRAGSVDVHMFNLDEDEFKLLEDEKPAE